MLTSNKYEREFGLFLYNVMLILDNYAKRTSPIFVLLVKMFRNNSSIVQEWQNFYFIFNHPAFISENEIFQDSCRIVQEWTVLVLVPVTQKHRVVTLK